MITIGEAIKKARTEKGYTKYRLAKETNLTYQTVDKWEKNFSVFGKLPGKL